MSKLEQTGEECQACEFTATENGGPFRLHRVVIRSAQTQELWVCDVCFGTYLPRAMLQGEPWWQVIQANNRNTNRILAALRALQLPQAE